MNASRRKELDRAIGLLEEAKSIIETVKSDEEDAFGNMPQSFQDGEKGELMQAGIDALGEFEGNIDSAVENIETAKGDA